MKEKALKITCITLLLVFSIIIVALVSYIYKLQDKIDMQNTMVEEKIENIIEENVLQKEINENENNNQDTTLDKSKNSNENIDSVSGKVGEFFDVKDNDENGNVIDETENGRYAGWKDEFIGGCGWWCTVEEMKEESKASSTLKNDKHINYTSNNVLDMLRSNSWVEGVDGDGIGEWIEISKQYVCYQGDKDGGKLGEICIVSGYANNEKLWKENNRVKKLLMYVDNQPYTYIELEDTIKPQYFNVWDNESYQLEPSQEIKLKFEIAEVYEGTKYDDTAITYIGVDFLKGH